MDTVEARQVCTNEHDICQIDINTMKKEDAHFSSPFVLTAKRNDYVHALVGYFSCTFSACHVPIEFSTSPRSRGTHWKQTVFYLEEPIIVCQGETIEGTLKCVPNADNPRDLDIVIEYAIDGARSSVQRVQEYKMR